MEASNSVYASVQPTISRLLQLQPSAVVAACHFISSASDSSTASAAAVASALRYHKHSKVLEVDFSSGESFNYSAELLRVASPSADNKTLKATGRPKVVAGRRHVGIMSIEPVGSYAVRLHFDDLHRSGIYSWEFLHDLGRNKWAIKRSYIELLRQQGLRRDPASLTQRKGTVAGRPGNLSS